jgi:hypothetical protein
MRCSRVPPGIHVPLVEYHWCTLRILDSRARNAQERLLTCIRVWVGALLRNEGGRTRCGRINVGCSATRQFSYSWRASQWQGPSASVNRDVLMNSKTPTGENDINKWMRLYLPGRTAYVHALLHNSGPVSSVTRKSGCGYCNFHVISGRHPIGTLARHHFRSLSGHIIIIIIIIIMCIFVCCLTVVPLPPGKNPFAVQLNNNERTKLRGLSPRANYADQATAVCRRSQCQLLRKFNSILY